MKSSALSSLAHAASLILGGGGQQQQHGRNLVSSIADGILYSQQQQHRRGLLDHPAYLLQTVQNSFNEAVQVCNINLDALSFFERNEHNKTQLQMDVALLKHYASLIPATCSNTDEQIFRTALATFQTCSSLDVEGLLETLGDAVLGSVLDCATAIAPLVKHITKGSDLFLDSMAIPVQCTNALLGKNPLGDVIRNTILNPDTILPCFTTLSTNLPNCTVPEWPVPLVGPILQTSSCLVGETIHFFAKLSQHNLDLLDVCLPELDDVDYDKSYGGGGDGADTAARKIDCNAYCSDLVGTEVLMNIPFTNLGQRVAETNGLQDVIPRFEAFAAQCLDAPWDGWSYPINDYDAINLKQYPQQHNNNPGSGAAAGAAGAAGGGGGGGAVSNSVYYDDDDGDADRFGMGFATGFFTGLLAAVVMWTVVQWCRQRLMQMLKQKQLRQQDTKINTNIASGKERGDDTGSSSEDYGGDDLSDLGEDIYEDMTHCIT